MNDQNEPLIQKEETTKEYKFFDPRGWLIGTWIRLALLIIFVTAVVVGITVFHIQTYLIDLLVHVFT